MELLSINDVQVYLILWFLFSSEYIHHKALEAGFGGRIFYRTILNDIITLYAKLAFIAQIILIVRISSNLNFSILQGIVVYFTGLIVYIVGGILIRGLLGRVLGVSLSFFSLFIIPFLIYKLW